MWTSSTDTLSEDAHTVPYPSIYASENDLIVHREVSLGQNNTALFEQYWETCPFDFLEENTDESIDNLDSALQCERHLAYISTFATVKVPGLTGAAGVSIHRWIVKQVARLQVATIKHKNYVHNLGFEGCWETAVDRYTYSQWQSWLTDWLRIHSLLGFLCFINHCQMVVEWLSSPVDYHNNDYLAAKHLLKGCFANARTTSNNIFN